MESMKLVNFVRSEVKQDKKPTDIAKNQFADDKYLQPVLDDDAVLFSLDDTDEASVGGDQSEQPTRPTPDAAAQDKFLREAEARSDVPEAAKGRSAIERNDSSYFESYSTRGIAAERLCIFKVAHLENRNPRDDAQGQSTNRRLQRFHLQQ